MLVWAFGVHKPPKTGFHAWRPNNSLLLLWNYIGKLKEQKVYPGNQFKLPCAPPPRTFLHGCQIVHWDPLNAKRSCPKQKIGMGYLNAWFQWQQLI